VRSCAPSPFFPSRGRAPTSKRFGRHPVDVHGKLLICHGVVLIERRYHRRYPAVRIDHDHRTTSHLAVVTRGSAERDEPFVSGIATEQSLVT
jgi:hypothetical protein